MASVDSARAINPHCNVDIVQDAQGIRMTIPVEQLASNQKESQQTQYSLLGLRSTQEAIQGITVPDSSMPNFDETGQIAPPGAKLRVNATLWEDEGSLCFHVEVRGVCVARREDNHMINGSKLLNVAGMARGRRDRILKSEKLRHVMKIGPLHLKGVWIPLERALDLANNEKITSLLYPLFVHNIGALLYHPTNQTRTNAIAVIAAAEKRKQEQAHIRVNPADQNPPCNTLHVGNLPIDASEDELKAMFSKQRGYKRLCFRTKQNGSMCFVEFEDVSFATKALDELYGHPLHNSIKGGIRLSFSKNPLGVRSGQSMASPGQSSNLPNWSPFAPPTLPTAPNSASSVIGSISKAEFVWGATPTLRASEGTPPPSPRSPPRYDSTWQMYSEPLSSDSSLEIRLEYSSKDLGEHQSSFPHLTSVPEVKEERIQDEDNAKRPASTQGAINGSENEYLVERVLAEKISSGKQLFLIQWTGHSLAESTWEPVENLDASILDTWAEWKKLEAKGIHEKFDMDKFEAMQSRFLGDDTDDVHVKSQKVELEAKVPVSEESSLGYHGMDDIRRIVLRTLQSHGSSRTKADFLGVVADPKKIYDIEVSVHWGIRKFFQEQFKGVEQPTLGSVIVLTGTGQFAQATTVRQYLDQTWSGINTTTPILLRILQQALADGSSGWKSDNFALEIKLEDLRLENAKPCSVRVTGPAEIIVQTLQQLAWLGSALQTSDTSRVGRSQAHLSFLTYSGEQFEFMLGFLTDSISSEERSCWHDLFANPVVTYNFPIRARDSEIGLEISIPMMAALGGASQAVEFDGGLVIKGFSSMFVPVSRSGNSIQWHFIRNENEDRLEYWQADKRCPGRALLKDIDRDALKNTRAFVGWWGKTTTQLGTADADFGNIDWTAAREVLVPSLGGTIDVKALGLVNFGFVLTPKDSKFQLGVRDAYRRIIKHASRTHVVLYDTGDKRGWLVPLSAIIAHITQIRHFRDPFSCDDKAVNLIASDSTRDIYEASETMLMTNASVKLSDSEAGFTGYYFRDLVNSIWTSIENLMDQNSWNTERLGERSLRGWEFMDVVEEMSPVRHKETQLEETCGHWIHLARDINSLVFFASGFGDVIRPAAESMDGLCTVWSLVPKNKDYLTAGVSTLNTLYEKAGSQVTKKHLTSTHLQWDCGPTLFENCADSAKATCSCDRLQRIVDEAQMLPGTVQLPSMLEPQGAIIFGQTKAMQGRETQPEQDIEVRITNSNRISTAHYSSGWNTEETSPTSINPESEQETDFSDADPRSSYTTSRRPKRPHDDTDLNQDYRRVQRARPSKYREQIPVRETARKSMRKPKAEVECSNILDTYPQYTLASSIPKAEDVIVQNHVYRYREQNPFGLSSESVRS